mmetsp:Transcript_35843/g.113327  ORF Transcript_35843/g.113327 Transcript_35843/m.113327 type:complete len:305 (+) Transcript_35843:57-971(+)
MAYAHDQQISSTIPQDFQWARDMMLANRGDASTNVEAIRAAVEKFGPAPGAKKMLEWEREAAELAIKTGVYTVWRNIETKQECTRVGPNSRCFCGHLHKSHAEGGGQCNGPKDTACACKYFEFIPRRPEEVGEWWLPRRKGFDVTQWRAKCRCKHSHSDHMGGANIMRRCTAPDCGCSCFQSDFLCVVCDRRAHPHPTPYTLHPIPHTLNPLLRLHCPFRLGGPRDPPGRGWGAEGGGEAHGRRVLPPLGQSRHTEASFRSGAVGPVEPRGARGALRARQRGDAAGGDEGLLGGPGRARAYSKP